MLLFHLSQFLLNYFERWAYEYNLIYTHYGSIYCFIHINNEQFIKNFITDNTIKLDVIVICKLTKRVSFPKDLGESFIVSQSLVKIWNELDTAWFGCF